MKKSTIIIWHIVYAVLCFGAPLLFLDDSGETQRALVAFMYGFFTLILGLIYWFLGMFNLPAPLKKIDSITGPILFILGLIFIIGNFIKVSETQTRYDDGFVLTSIDKDYILSIPAGSEITRNTSYDSTSVKFGLFSDFPLEDSTKINIIKSEVSYLWSFIGVPNRHYINVYYDKEEIDLTPIRRYN